MKPSNFPCISQDHQDRQTAALLADTRAAASRVSFAAGTLVHTDKGLLPIEQVRVGTRVLAQPEDLYEQAALDAGKYPGEEGSQRSLRPVVNTVAHLDQHVFAVQIKPYSQQQATDATDPTTELSNDPTNPLTTLIATPGHPFWVEGHEWLAVDQLQPGHRLHLSDGSYATVHAAGLVRRTQHAHIGFAADERANNGSGAGIVLNLRGGRITQASEALAQELALDQTPLELGDPYLTTVYNFEVQGFHTYYVGDIGVWVHNDECSVAQARKAAFSDALLTQQCFEGDTVVWMDDTKGELCSCEIEAIQVGDRVMSRCETTGEMAFKRVVKVIESTSSVCLVRYLHNDFDMPMRVTQEHPFWVQNKGWTAVRDLQVGDEFLTYDGDQATVCQIELNTSFATIYNLEVEDFHTYFVTGAQIWVHNKNREIKVTTFNTNAVTNPRPEWSPIYKTTAEMTDANGVALPEYRAAVRERRIEPLLNGAGIQTLSLPARDVVEARASGRRLQNNLGKFDSQGKQLGYPDDILISERHPDLNGAVADRYQPTGSTSLGVVLNEIAVKSKNQSSVLIIDLTDASLVVLPGDLAKALDGTISAPYFDRNTGLTTQLTGPIETLKTILLIDGKGGMQRIDYPDTSYNKVQYATAIVTENGIYTTRLNRPPQIGSQVIVRNYPSRYTNYQEVTESGAATQIAPITLSDIQSLLPAARQYWLTAGASPALLDAAVVEVGALVPSLAGITIGNQITLDVDGAGWGWFVDASPASHQEFVATDEDHMFEAAEFVAQSTSPAHGKLDLLTVLVHELGHVLGLHHSPDGDAEADNLMAQFLTPGVRRIPDAHELAALAALQTSGDNLFAVGATFATAVPNASNPAPTPAPWQAVPVLPRFTGGGFTDAAVGWQSTGRVTLDGQGSVVLQESTTAQTRLAQGFTINPGDRYLSFTVAQDGLQANGSGPQDAFEVALLDATILACIREISIGDEDGF